MRRIIKIMSAVCGLWLTACASAYAGLAVSVAGGDWAIGTIGMGISSETTAGKWTVTGSADTSESVDIKVDGTNWHPGAAAADKVFVLKHDASGSWSAAITNTGGGIYLASLAAGGTKAFDLQFTAPTASTDVIGEQSLTVTLTARQWAAGDDLSIAHDTAGGVAPVTTTITYGTVVTNLTGTDKCWITRNLGASQQATSATDATNASAGWYWQFNRKQGYAPGPDPAWTITGIDEDSDWVSANDPCTIELGSGWRIPTSTEWTNVNSSGGWANYNDAYASVLKLHAAGIMYNSSGWLANQGVEGYYWSSTQASGPSASDLYLKSSSSGITTYVNKATGFSIRCLKD